jgi:hypothetical protein
MATIPRPERMRLPAKSFVAVPATNIQVYHLVMNDPPQPSDFEVGKLSWYEADGDPEIERLGFSCFRSQMQADSWHKRAGSMIAVVRLTPGLRVHIARAEPPPGHVIIWGLPETLAAVSSVVAGPRGE